MDVRCDKCQTIYSLDEQTIGDAGITMKCAQCGHLFRVRKKGAPIPTPRNEHTPLPAPKESESPSDKTWLVRIAKTQETFRLKELTTLQQWIVEGRVTRADEISLGGTKWKGIGGIPDLQPFFELVAKAKTSASAEQEPTSNRPSARLGPSRELGGIAENAERDEQRTALSRPSLLLPMGLLALAAIGGGGAYAYHRGWISGAQVETKPVVVAPPKVVEAPDAAVVAGVTSGALDEAAQALLTDSDESLVDAARQYRAITTDPKFGGAAFVGEARAEIMRGRYLFEQAPKFERCRRGEREKNAGARGCESLARSQISATRRRAKKCACARVGHCESRLSRCDQSA